MHEEENRPKMSQQGRRENRSFYILLVAVETVPPLWRVVFMIVTIKITNVPTL